MKQRKISSLVLGLVLVLVCVSSGVTTAVAQPFNSPANSLRSGATNPTTCRQRGFNIFYNTTSGLQTCTANDTWGLLLGSATFTGPVLLPEGTNGAPSWGFAGDSDNGARFADTSGWFVSISSPRTYMHTGGVRTQTGYGYEWSGTSNPIGAPVTGVYSLGTANPQWGINSATPVAYTHNLAPGGSGTDIAGASVSVGPGFSTGAPASTPRFTIFGSTLGVIASGTTAHTVANGGLVGRAIFDASKVLTNNSAIAIVNATAAANTSIAVVIKYAVQVFDGTDLQVEHGEVGCTVINKGGAFSGNVCTKYGDAQAVSAGTLAVTVAITGANPAVISVNANSSLAPSAGFPRIVYELSNLTQQAVAIQ